MIVNKIYKTLFLTKYINPNNQNLIFFRLFNSNPLFDTKKFINKLEDDVKFDRKQAEALVHILNNVMNNGLWTFARNFVLKENLSQLSLLQKVELVKLKNDLQMIDKTEFIELKKDQECFQRKLTSLKNKLKEEISKNVAGVKLDLNLEKGRIREESSIHELKIEETYTRIDEEIANLQMQIKSMKTHVMQWLIGVSSGSFALMLTFIRFFG